MKTKPPSITRIVEKKQLCFVSLVKVTEHFADPSDFESSPESVGEIDLRPGLRKAPLALRAPQLRLVASSK